MRKSTGFAYTRALCAEARQLRRHGQVRAVARHVELLGHELRLLDGEIERWDGTDPPLLHLAERLETVETGLTRVEASLRTLRPSD